MEKLRTKVGAILVMLLMAFTMILSYAPMAFASPASTTAQKGAFTVLAPVPADPSPSPDASEGDDAEEDEEAEDEGEKNKSANGDDYTFYKLASEVNAYFTKLIEPDGEKSEGEDSGASEEAVKDLEALNTSVKISQPANAGSFLGYADPDFLEDFTGWLTSKVSQGSITYSYDSFIPSKENLQGLGKMPSGSTNGLLSYSYFGAANAGLGFDSTDMGMITHMTRWLSGLLMWLLYWLSGAIDLLMSFVIDLLVITNPFTLLKSVSDSTLKSLGGSDALAGINNPAIPFGGLAAMVSNFFDMLYEYIVPIVIVFSAVAFVIYMVIKRNGRTHLFHTFMSRIIFLVAGIPLLGMAYTSVLDYMDANLDSGDLGTTRVIMSTYVDYEKWMMDTRMSIPSGAYIAWDDKTGAPSQLAIQKIRSSALEINRLAYGDDENDPLSKLKGVSDGSVGGVSGSSDQFSVTDDLTDEQRSKVSGASNQYDASNFTLTARVSDMLLRYTNGSQVTSSDFETAAKADMSRRVKAAKNLKDLYDVDKLLGNKSAPEGNTSTETNDYSALIRVKNDFGLDYVNPTTNEWKFFTRDGTRRCGAVSATPQMNPYECNLAPLTTYNYLNTQFDPSKMYVYSGVKSPTLSSRVLHNSVNLVGTSGASSFVMWLNAAILMMSFLMIAVSYGIALIVMAFKKGFQVIFTMPIALFGVLPMIAKVIAIVVSMVIEVIGTIFFYKLIQEVLIALPQIIEIPFNSFTTGGSGGSGHGANNPNLSTIALSNLGFNEQTLRGFGVVADISWADAISLIIVIITLIIIVMFTTIAMRIRSSFIRAIDETMQRVIERIVGVSAGAAAPNGMPGIGGRSALGQGARAALGMGAMGAMSRGLGALGGAAAAQGAEGLNAGGAQDGDGSDPQDPNAVDGNNPQAIEGGEAGTSGADGNNAESMNAGGTVALGDNVTEDGTSMNSEDGDNVLAASNMDNASNIDADSVSDSAVAAETAGGLYGKDGSDSVVASNASLNASGTAGGSGVVDADSNTSVEAEGSNTAIDASGSGTVGVAGEAGAGGAGGASGVGAVVEGGAGGNVETGNLMSDVATGAAIGSAMGSGGAGGASGTVTGAAGAAGGTGGMGGPETIGGTSGATGTPGGMSGNAGSAGGSSLNGAGNRGGGSIDATQSASGAGASGATGGSSATGGPSVATSGGGSSMSGATQPQQSRFRSAMGKVGRAAAVGSVVGGAVLAAPIGGAAIASAAGGFMMLGGGAAMKKMGVSPVPSFVKNSAVGRAMGSITDKVSGAASSVAGSVMSSNAMAAIASTKFGHYATTKALPAVAARGAGFVAGGTVGNLPGALIGYKSMGGLSQRWQEAATQRIDRAVADRNVRLGRVTNPGNQSNQSV